MIPPPARGVMFRVCSVCRVELAPRAVAHDDPANGQTSHGLCPTCERREALLLKLDVFRATPCTYQLQIVGSITEEDARALQERAGYPIKRYGFRGFAYLAGGAFLPVTTWVCDAEASLD